MRDRLRARHGMLMAAVAAAALACGALRGLDARFANPPSDYTAMADQISQGSVVNASRLPFYPAFIALVRGLRPGPAVDAVVAAQVLLGAWAAVLVFSIGCLLASPVGGLIAAALLLGSGLYARSLFVVEVEFLFSFLALGVAAQYILWCEDGSRRRALLLAASIGLCLSARSTFFLLPPFLLIFHRLSPLGKASPSRSLGLVAAAYLALVPWTLRNLAHRGDFIPFEDGTEFIRVFQASAGELETNRPTSEVQAMAASSRPDLRGLDPGDINRRLHALAWERVLAHPAAFAAGCAQRLVLWLGYNWGLSLLFVAALCWPGLDARKWAMAAIPAYLALIHAPLALTDRLTVPAIPPLCALAGCWIDVRLPGYAAASAEVRARDRGRLAAFAACSLALSAIPFFYSVWACR